MNAYFDLFTKKTESVSHHVCVCCVGPAEKLADADSWTTSIRDGAVKLRLTASGHGAVPPVTVMTAFKQTVDRVPNRTALGQFYTRAYTASNSIEVQKLS